MRIRLKPAYYEGVQWQGTNVEDFEQLLPRNTEHNISDTQLSFLLPPAAEDQPRELIVLFLHDWLIRSDAGSALTLCTNEQFDELFEVATEFVPTGNEGQISEH